VQRCDSGPQERSSTDPTGLCFVFVLAHLPANISIQRREETLVARPGEELCGGRAGRVRNSDRGVVSGIFINKKEEEETGTEEPQTRINSRARALLTKSKPRKKKRPPRKR
jgi:hypothetical protein